MFPTIIQINMLILMQILLERIKNFSFNSIEMKLIPINYLVGSKKFYFIMTKHLLR